MIRFFVIRQFFDVIRWFFDDGGCFSLFFEDQCLYRHQVNVLIQIPPILLLPTPTEYGGLNYILM